MYHKILKVWRSEKTNQQIQPLDTDFYNDLKHYISQLEQDLNRPNISSLNHRLLTIEIQNVKRLANEIIRTRLTKMVHDIQNGIQLTPDQIPDEEHKIIQNLNTITEIKDRLKDFTVITQHKAKNQKKKKLIRMLQPLKKVVCIDMKAYGPFEAEDVVTLPEENANILIEKGLAVGVET
ncbi:DNA replication complex subunit Gins51 [[Eubacterium] cellulosolvens]